MLHYLVIAALLFLFWLTLSGHLTLGFLILGLISSLLVLFLQHRMDQVDKEPATLRISFRLFHYLGWLIQQVIKSNIDITWRIWHPSLPIEPQWECVKTKLTSKHERTLYANSITLTPGSLTTDIHDNYFMVHTLTEEDLKQLNQGEMERRIKQLGI